MKYFLSLVLLLCMYEKSFSGCGNVFISELSNGISEQEIRSRFDFISNFALRNSSPSSTDTFRIPVVFNILYRDSISDSLLFDKSRYYRVLDTANKYLNIELSYLYSINHPTFHDIIAVPYIQLIPARLDPQGQPTTGFRYKRWTPVSGNDICGLLYFNAQQKIKLDGYGGITAWDNRNYLNYWVGDYHTPTQCFSGQSTYPVFPFLTGQPLNYMDGIILQDYVIKSNNFWRNYSYSTIMHELGHYLGLLHIWGGLFDDSERGCNIDDNIRDTPTQFQAIYACTDSINSCNDGASDKIDMCSNVMDYADGITYTIQQVNVMHNTLLNARKLLPIPRLTAQLQQNNFSVCQQDTITLLWQDNSAVRSDFVIPSWDAVTRVLTKSFIANQDTSFSVFLTNGYDTLYQTVHVHILTQQVTQQFPSVIHESDTLRLQLQDIVQIHSPISYQLNGNTFTFVATGATDSFWVYYSNACGNDSTFITYSITQNPTGFVHAPTKTFSVFPNPANNMLFLQDIDANSTISIFSLEGKVMLSTQAKQYLDISTLPNGTYIIQATNVHDTFIGKFIKIGN